MAIVACTASGASSSLAQHTSRRAWWGDPNIQRELGLNSGQIAHLGAIFRQDLAARRARQDSIQRLEAALLQSMRDGDDAAATRCSTALEHLRQLQNTRRTTMLLKMYRVLTPEQRRKLAAIADHTSRQ
jgi:Spy/CpxP family protein refolding chaperone